MSSSEEHSWKTTEFSKHPKFRTPIVLKISPAKPHSYKLNLMPAPSPLHPHCLAHHCLACWIPAITAPHTVDSTECGPLLMDTDIERVMLVFGASITEAMKELYGTDLLVFHVYCNTKNVPDDQWAPVSHNLLATFLANCTGAYVGSMISNYTTAIKAWHILHGLEWKIKDTEYKVLLKGTARLAPVSSKRTKVASFTVEILERFCLCMDLNNPCDMAIFACLICFFFSIARLGEFTAPAIANFNLQKHIMLTCTKSV